MKKIILFSLILCVVAVEHAAAQMNGTIVTDTIHSQALLDNKIGLNPSREVKIYLPPSYAKSSAKRYPVVYYCPTIFQSPQQVLESAAPLIDRAIASGGSKEFILVVASYRGPGIGSLYENSSTTGHWLDFTTEELVPFIDKKFRTIKRADARAVVGDYIGGRGALKLAMTYPNLFGAVYALHPVATGSGTIPWVMLNINWLKISKAKTIEELAGPDRTAIFVAIHQAFLPNPDRPPFYCDFSYEIENGQRKLIPENLLKTKKGFHLDETLTESAGNLRQLKGIALDWGRYDETTAHVESNREFSTKLEDLGIEHTAEEYNGVPGNKNWTDDGRFYTRVIPFINRYLSFER